MNGAAVAISPIRSSLIVLMSVAKAPSEPSRNKARIRLPRRAVWHLEGGLSLRLKESNYLTKSRNL